MRFGALWLCAGLVLAAVPALADDVSADLACKFRHPVSEVDSFDSMPPAIVALVRSKMEVGTLATDQFLAPRGGFFNATDDIIGPAPNRRFIRAGHSGHRWFLWYEHGGIAYIKNIALFDLPADGGAPQLVALIGYFNENPCVLTDLVFDGHTPPQAARSAWW